MDLDRFSTDGSVIKLLTSNYYQVNVFAPFRHRATVLTLSSVLLPGPDDDAVI
jgi:hypothetical protein